MEPKEEIREKIDIADLISGYLELKPSGMGSFKALCPFHGERTPSFHISTDKQIWHCFGCNRGGDIFAFVMEMEGMDFVEALKLLAERAGVTLPEFKGQKDGAKKSSAYDLNDQAAKVYAKILHEHPQAQEARGYLERRGVGAELIETFALGYAPESWDFLQKTLVRGGVSGGDLETAGLVKKSDKGGWIDRFRGRVMIPLCDAQGRVVGFTGRIMATDSKAPKYLNSPETEIYHKGKVLYGLHLAKAAVRTEGRVVIVEGNMDVVASHKAGVREVVASSGTALTEHQLAILKRITNTIAFSFDGDAAGFEAARKGIRLAQGLGMDVQVIAIPPELGKDPDDVVQKDPKAWAALVRNPIHVMDYYIRQGKRKFDLTSPVGKREFGLEILNEIKQLESRIEQEHWIARLSDLIAVDIQILRQTLRPEAGKRVTVRPPAPKPAPAIKTSMQEKASQWLIAMVLLSETERQSIFEAITPDLFQDPWGGIYNKLKNQYTSTQASPSAQHTTIPQLESVLTSEEYALVRGAVARGEQALGELTAAQVRKEVADHVSILKGSFKQQRRTELQALIREAEKSGDADALKSLIQEYTSLL
jgi:DNA primase